MKHQVIALFRHVLLYCVPSVGEGLNGMAR
jgi:hypothetical protein